MTTEYQMYDGRTIRFHHAKDLRDGGVWVDQDEKPVDYQGYWAWCPKIPDGCETFVVASRGAYCRNTGNCVIGRELVFGAFSLELDGEICEVKRVTYLSP